MIKLKIIYQLKNLPAAKKLKASSFLSLLLSLPDVLDALVKSASDLSLRDAEPGLGGDVDGAVSADGGVLATETTDGEAEGVADGLGLDVGAVRGQLGESDVDGGPHAGTDVGGAGGDDAGPLGLGAAAGDQALDDVDGGLQAVEDVVDEDGLLHGHDPEVILLAAPDDEAFVGGDVAATAVGPVTGDAGVDEVGVGGHVLEHDVGLDQLLVPLLGHLLGVAGGEGDVLAAELGHRDELVEDGAHGVLHGAPVVLVHGAGEGELLEVPGGPDPHGEGSEAEGGDVELAVSGQALAGSEVPVVLVALGSQVDLVVLLKDGLEE